MTSGQTEGRYEGKHLRKKEKKPRKHPVLRVFGIIFLCLALIAAACGVTYYILYRSGRASMLVYDREDISVTLPTQQVPESEAEQPARPLTPDDGRTVLYDGHTYRLNTNLTTILFLGVDKRELAEDAVSGEGGQADAVMLIAMDTETGKTKLLCISREAYAQVDVYSAGGSFIGTRSEQLCLAYAYGDGKKTSCENMRRSVSRLLYGLPIGKYLALDMDGVVAANEAVGGVTLTSISDLKLYESGRELHAGEEITLHGRDAEAYIRARDHAKLESNLERMERQKQYMLEFAKLVTTRSKEDLTTPVTLFSALSPYMETDLSLSDVAFLSTCYLQNGAAFDFRSVDGTADRLNGSPVYYLDDEDLFEAILDVFYLKEE